MSLISCSDCGHVISKRAKYCPKCGAPNKKKTSLLMKVFLIFLAILILPRLLVDSYSSYKPSSSVKMQPVKEREEQPLEKASIASKTEGELIPRSMFDRGKYYLLSQKLNGTNIIAVHKRVGVNSIGYTRTETNCDTMRMRELGYTEKSVDQIPHNPSRWFDLVEGSSKSDLANFLCK